MLYRNPLNIPGGQLPRSPQRFIPSPFGGVLIPTPSTLGATIDTSTKAFQTLNDIGNLIQSPNTWFNVVAVVLGVLFIIIGAGAIARKSA